MNVFYYLMDLKPMLALLVVILLVKGVRAVFHKPAS